MIFLNWCAHRALWKEITFLDKRKQSRTITKHFKRTSPNTCVHSAWQLIIHFIKSRTIPNPKFRWLMTIAVVLRFSLFFFCRIFVAISWKSHARIYFYAKRSKDWKIERLKDNNMTFGVATKIHTRLNAECRRTLLVFDL